MPPYTVKNVPTSSYVIGGLGDAAKATLQFYLAHKNMKAYQDRTKYYQDIMAREDAKRQGGQVAGANPLAGVKLRKPALPGVPDPPAVGGDPDPPTDDATQFHPLAPETSSLDQAMSPEMTDMGGTPLPAYAQGTPFVPRTGPALIHQGEEVVPADENPNNPGVEAAQAMEPPPRASMIPARPQAMATEPESIAASMEPPPRASVIAQRPQAMTLEAPGPTGGAEATPTGGGPLQQAEEYQVDPKVLDAYKRAGQADVERQRFQAQLKGEMNQYRQTEAELAKLIFHARRLKTELDIARKNDPEKVPALEAKLEALQSDHKYYEKQLGDFRETVLGLATDDEGNIVDKHLHEGLTHWLDKGATAGERAGIEQGLSSHSRRAPSLGRGPSMPEQPRIRRQSVPVSAAVLGGQQL